MQNIPILGDRKDVPRLQDVPMAMSEVGILGGISATDRGTQSKELQLHQVVNGLGGMLDVQS